jgi:hypothetical protein
MLRTKRDGRRRLVMGLRRGSGAECAVALSVDMKLYDGLNGRILPRSRLAVADFDRRA